MPPIISRKMWEECQRQKEINQRTYTKVGNILNKKYYELTNNNVIKEDSYEYTNPNWEDQLTSFNNTNITYDAIGNPLTIGNDTLSWINGRELKAYQINNNKVEYQYNNDGIRTRKVIKQIISPEGPKPPGIDPEPRIGPIEPGMPGTDPNPIPDGPKWIETTYHVEGSQIIFEQRGSDVIYYLRDSNGELIGLKYNSDTYYYQKNMQGDIIGILDDSLEQLGLYKYDSWGKVLSIKDADGKDISNKQTHIANINP